MKKIMIAVGEASGDHHGARVVHALKRRHPDAFFCGIGGHEMQKAGVEIVVNMAELSVVGLTEVFIHLPRIFRAMKTAKACLKTIRPDLLILIDYPDFNLRLAAYARKLGIRVLYYVSPQVWAWRSGRVRNIGKVVDHMAVILPFEQNFYHKHRIPVTFVGHPLMDKHLPPPAPDFEDRFDKPPVVGLLPGSRNGEVTKLLPVILDAARLLYQQNPEIRFVVSHTPSVDTALIARILEDHGKGLPLSLENKGVDYVYDQCSFIIAASGTVTLETALAGLPMTVVYKVSPVSYQIGKALINVDYISLVNLISGKELVPELIQHEASPEKIAETVSFMLADRPGLKRLSRDLLGLRNRLGGAGAGERVAEIAANLMKS